MIHAVTVVTKEKPIIAETLRGKNDLHSVHHSSGQISRIDLPPIARHAPLSHNLHPAKLQKKYRFQHGSAPVLPMVLNGRKTCPLFGNSYQVCNLDSIYFQ